MPAALWPGLLVALLVAGCGAAGDGDSGGGGGELSAWMAAQRSRAHPRIQPIEPPARFAAQPYVGEGERDPFDEQKLLQLLRREVRPSSAQALIEAQRERPREPLEAYPLDSMAMVGSLSQAGRTVALLRVDRTVHLVGVGDRLGQNHGRVTRVEDGALVLVEIVQDAAGEWIERPATLRLQEGPDGQKGPGRPGT
ncbi:MAG: pilus assembly protein PilP [Comamonas sp.]